MTNIGNKEIKDFNHYVEEMAKAMEDKLFFTKFIDYNKWWQFVDFGCANGTLLQALSCMKAFENSQFCGFDASKEMIALAKAQWEGSPSINFTSNWGDIEFNEDSVLILSSVLHEIYSYNRIGAINDFWEQIFDSQAKHIVIRDMCFSEDMNRRIYDEGNDDYDAEHKLIGAFIDEYCKSDKYKPVEEKYNQNRINQFINRWGSLNNVKNFLHLLLKHKYIINWERELEENYFSLSVDELLHRIEKSPYNIVYLERFQLPTIYDYTHPKFAFRNVIEDNTHIKMILNLKGTY